MTNSTIGFFPDEIDTASPTRSARLKWVVAVDSSLPGGRAVNAAVCVAAATSTAVAGLLGPDAIDADGSAHPGLPWAGCTIVGATSEQLHTIRAKAEGSADVFVADMPAAAQSTRVYDEYLGEVAGSGTEALELLAVSIVGPRNRVDRLVGRLPLLP
ncbi:DUF2000 domain-containing protein [Labedella phragmitis]|uniref:DUF2000 domain-containing protein n=1 Tax=Labedella phragmitis TaxID=2498849 RepID=A0A444PUC9_9MICO|nr:DUF2000 domain-containing protein [Labedella phragmitis]RWZ51476.1 DUF2000 domain-containing protein [Labedella phragmitis]